MPLNAFIVRPFGVKELILDGREEIAELKQLAGNNGTASLIDSVLQIGDTPNWKVRVNFDAVHQLLISPAAERVRIHAETTGAIVVAGNIREDMFNRLVTADLVIADLSVHNANVFYELGVRQAFRDKYTFLIRCNLSNYPFDLQTDRYFEYGLVELVKRPDAVVRRLAEALRATVASNEADSPVFKLLPQLAAEDRGRFIAVPNEFLEEVERARSHRHREHLSLLAVECDGFLWEIEGLRVVGRAQFESNFIESAKSTWENIVGRYPDDIEANTVLSTIYQRLNEMTRSEQALARVSRARWLPPSRLSQLRSLSGRNLKEAWVTHWRRSGNSRDEWQRAALMSPLLQRACDAYLDAFKADLNNSYAGLNALTMLVVQTELAMKHETVWAGIQRQPDDARRELKLRMERIQQLIAALELAVESDRERLAVQGVADPWFGLLEAAAMSIISAQPEHVALLYESAKHYAPDNAEESMRRALETYQDLGIEGRDHDAKWQIGTIGSNVRRALDVLRAPDRTRERSSELQRVLMFVGLRLDHANLDSDAEPALAEIAAMAPGSRRGFPPSCVDAARQAIERAIDEEIKLSGSVVLGLAAAANGGDLLFHEACRAHKIPTRMCLALPRSQYVGEYVAPAGKEWVERFSTIYRDVQARDPVRVFADANELPRWLQGKPLYNVGRRNNLWMLQHAIATAIELGDNAEITLLALWNGDSSEGGVGGIGNVIRLAQSHGIKVHTVAVPRRGNGGAARDGDDASRRGSGPTAAAPLAKVDAERAPKRAA